MNFRKEISYDLIHGQTIKYYINCKDVEIKQVIKLLEEELKE